MFDDPKSKINQLEKILDAREDKVSKRIKRHDLSEHESDIPQDWNDEEFSAGEGYIKPIVGAEVTKTLTFSGTTETLQGGEGGNTKKHWTVKLLMAAGLFFLLAIVAIIYKIFFGGIIVSGDNIDITVRAPISVAGGESLPIEIEVSNNNNVQLLGADLGITFPAGTMQATDLSVPLKHEQIFLGDIAPGKSQRKNLTVVIFGGENEKKNLELSLEYKVTGSNSTFTKKKVIPVLLTSSPISLSLTSPKSVNTNQIANFELTINSNSSVTIKNLLLVVNYPFGFTFVGANPSPANKNNSWLIGDLAPGEKRVIKLAGILTGQEGEERGFTFTLGNQAKTDNTAIDTPFNSTFASVVINRPFVSADLYFDGSDNREVASAAGNKIDGVIRWKNNLPYQVNNVIITVKLGGNALNKGSVQTEQGFYRSLDNIITFDKNTFSSFASLEPGQSGELKFELKSFAANTSSGSILTNPLISVDLSVQAKAVNNSGQTDNISFTDSRKIKITSEPSLYAKSLYYVGPFTNSGPIPPKAETETTYTITWTLTNPLNNLSGAKVTTTLPLYVKWNDRVTTGNYPGTLEHITFNNENRQVTWSLGNVLAGTGISSAAREVSFQVSITPSVSQLGSAPGLTDEIQLIAKDAFTSAEIVKSIDGVDTHLLSDPYFKAETDKVVK